jgi:predicted TIM-barrel fold metal-dependent hydrolase
MGSDIAICNCLYGSQAVYNQDLAAALCRATNDWLAEEWLGKDDRFRASIVIPGSLRSLLPRRSNAAPRSALCSSSDDGVGRNAARQTADVADLCRCRKARSSSGNSFGHNLSLRTMDQWLAIVPYRRSGRAKRGFSDSASQPDHRGRLREIPRLNVVLLESGVTWLPSFLWRIDKLWRGLRMEVPWLKRAPSETVKERVRLTMQPFDGPSDPQIIREMIDQIGADMMLFSTDYPHWNFDGVDFAPVGFDADLMTKLRTENPMNTYARLREI